MALSARVTDELTWYNVPFLCHLFVTEELFDRAGHVFQFGAPRRGQLLPGAAAVRGLKLKSTQLNTGQPKDREQKNAQEPFVSRRHCLGSKLAQN